MKPTRASALVIAALCTAVASYLIGTYLVSRGMALPVSGFNLMFTLPGIAILLAIFALPIWRYRRQTLKIAKAKQAVSNQPAPIKRVDPFYAVRILLLAKATALASALFVGWHLGLVILQAAAPELTDAFFKNLFTMFGAVVSLAVALLIEWICRIPDSGDDSENSMNLKPTAMPQARLEADKRNLFHD